jgi:putative methyltransferase (TIGR04325 family)
MEFEGPFQTWRDAAASADGWDAPEIAEHILIGALKVKAGDAVYERDGVLFDHIVYSPAILAALLLAAARYGALSIVDFGGVASAATIFRTSASCKH